MPTPCIHCQHPLNTPGVCSKCNRQNFVSTNLGASSSSTRPSSTTCSSTTVFQVLPQSPRFPAARQQTPHHLNDNQIQITQQLQARSKLTTLQPKPVRLLTPRVLNRSPARPRLNQNPIASSSASQVIQQIRQRCRVQGPRAQNIVPPQQGVTKYRLVPKSDLEHPSNRTQETNGVDKNSPAGSSIRIVRTATSGHNTSPVAAVIRSSSSAPSTRITHLVRSVDPIVGHSVAPSQQLVEVVEPTVSAVVSPTTPALPSQYKVTVSNGHTPLYKIVYPISSRPAIAGFTSSQLTPLTVSDSQLVSSVLVTPSGAFQVFRHAANPSAQLQQNISNFRRITHQSMPMMSPTRTRLLRSKALPSVQSRLAIEPPPVVTIDDEDISSSREETEKEAEGGMDVDPGIADSNRDEYKLTVLKHPDKIDRGEFRICAQQVRVGSFLLRDRIVTFSRSNLRILARPVDSLTEEVELNFTFKDILKTMWALCADTPAIVFNFSPDCGARIREALHMQYHDAVKDRRCNDAKHPYFEPKASLERQRQVIILLGESLSEEEYRLIQDCYMSPKGQMKKEFAEKLLQLTAPNLDSPETPLPVGESVPDLIEPQRPGSSPAPNTGTRKRKQDEASPSHIVTDNGIVTVMAIPTTRDAQKQVQLPPGVVFTNDSPMCQYPPSGKGCIVIRAPDLLTLMPDKSVNDAVIDFYLSYIIGELLPKERAEKVFAFNTFFYSSLAKDTRKTANTEVPVARRQHSNVKRWTKGVDLFEKDFILIPVCEHSHWFLIIVSYPWLVPKRLRIDMGRLNKNVGDPNLVETSTKDSPDSSTGDSDPLKVEGPQKDSPRAPPSSMTRKSDLKAGIFVFDSLRGNVTPPPVYSLIRSYLAEEFLAKKGVECSFDYYTMRGYYPIAPQQTNFHDCGIFLLEYAKEFLRNPPAPDDVGASSRFTKMFDPDHIMEEGRWEVAEVMFQLSEKQFPELKGVPRLKYEKLIKVKGKTVSEDTVQVKRTRTSNTSK